MKKIILTFLFCFFNVESFGGALDNTFNNIEISGEIRYRYEKVNKDFKSKKYIQKNTTKITIK